MYEIYEAKNATGRREVYELLRHFVAINKACDDQEFTIMEVSHKNNSNIIAIGNNGRQNCINLAHGRKVRHLEINQYTYKCTWDRLA